jgi:hypothetical protein
MAHVTSATRSKLGATSTPRLRQVPGGAFCISNTGASRAESLIDNRRSGESNNRSNTQDAPRRSAGVA